MSRRRVAIGGTFACDEALAVPLQYLLENAVWDVDVDLQWLRYGSLTDFDEWSADVLHAVRPVDLVLLLVRLSDLEAAHPELQGSKDNDVEEVDPERSDAGIPEGPIKHFISDLERYDAVATKSAAAPLVVVLCPCPPSSAARFDAKEREMQTIIGAMKSVDVQSAGRLMELFQLQYTTAFYDAVSDKRQHSPYTQAMQNVIGLSLCRQICRLFRSPSGQKKVIVLDCDNTLWGGAVAEVGASGIDLAPRFLALQRFVFKQQERGMLLALCSKNIREDVAQAFEQRRDDMVLDLDKHVVAAKVNWQPKSKNIAQLAQELSLGLDSFIFIDDNPLECNEVATALPTVTVITLGANFSESVLDHEWIFDEGKRATRRSWHSSNIFTTKFRL
ncbi:uncharacterized protein IUM83_04982 [Phytophthora cinnamomi]|uniref:uncharacterized protein n=1 Tax=Phytophthora cinnamomi TaxID=4785 RepID=UPI003559ADF8|nr:hypothetical protein IUM83_04982 [Phytophthora cinnamomi]